MQPDPPSSRQGVTSAYVKDFGETRWRDKQGARKEKHGAVLLEVGGAAIRQAQALRLEADCRLGVFHT